MAQHFANQFAAGLRDGNEVDPHDLISTGYTSPSFQNHAFHSPNPTNPSTSNAFSTGSALFGDDELLDGLNSPTDPGSGMANHGSHDFPGLDEMGMAFSHDNYGSHRGSAGLHLSQAHINNYSNTPDGDPIQSPYQHNFTGHPFRTNQLGTSLHSPISYSGSPHGPSEMNTDQGNDFLGSKARRGVAPAMQRNASATRSPMASKTGTVQGMPLGSQELGFGPQPIRTANMHDKSSSPARWVHGTGGSMGASFGSTFSSPLQGGGIMQINEVMMKAGTSMPAKLGTNAISSQEMKRKRRRESHNLVERRRRDNINERIQDLSRLVPTHRLEDEKVRKMLQNGTPMSPTLAVISTKPSSQATSGLAGPGARRAAGGPTGNITTGLPLDEKDKGPNKGDILNGAVSWTRDLMWMLHLKLQQQDELANYIADLGGVFPFQITEDEKRMQTELARAMEKNATDRFSYSRTPGTALRVPGHTDYRGDPLGSEGEVDEPLAIGPDVKGAATLISGDLDESGWPADSHYYDDDVHLKEEDEYEMDLN